MPDSTIGPLRTPGRLPLVAEPRHDLGEQLEPVTPLVCDQDPQVVRFVLGLSSDHSGHRRTLDGTLSVAWWALIGFALVVLIAAGGRATRK